MGRPRASKNVVTTWSPFSILRTEGTNGWGAFGKVRSPAWIRGAPQGKKALQTRSALARAVGCWGTSGALQGGHTRVGRGCKGWVSSTGKAKSLTQQLLESAEGKGGWMSVGAKLAAGQWRPCCSGRKPSEGRRWTHLHLLQLNKLPPHCSDGDPSKI